jgi:alkylation response protein AidB-like acyl-CoA dehydrogenase
MTTATLTALPSASMFTDEQNAFREAIQDFAQRECGTQEQREKLTNGYEDAQNMEIYAKLAELGWLGVAIPEEYGGSGGGMVDMCILLEEISRGLIPAGEFGISAIVAGAYERFGTDEQKQEILSGIAGGKVESIAMSEPEAGSDVGNLACKAERVNGHYVINGQKTWISGAHNAAHILLIARSERTGNKHEGLTMISPTPRAWRSGRSRPWAAARSTTSSSPTARSRPRASSARRGRRGRS